MAKVKKSSKKRKTTKKKKSDKFLINPQIKSGLFKFFLLWSALLTSGLIFTSFLLPKNQFQKIKEQILKNPDNLKTHLELTRVYLKNNQFREAEKELEKISKLQNPQISKQLEKELESLRQEKFNKDPQEIKKQIEAWKKIVKKYPDYRDGYLELTLLYLRLGKNKEAEKTLQKALEIDPNYKTTKELEKTSLLPFSF